MDRNFAADVEGSADKFGIVILVNGVLTRKSVGINDDNEIASVHNC
jgi:hypothetical protein